MSILRSALLILCLVASTSVCAVTVTLQEGLNGYNGTQDTYAWSGEEVNHGSMQYMNSNHTTTMGFVRFKIFASEGGPVPNGATIISATLSLHKLSGPSSTYEVRRLKRDWQEMQTTWTLAMTGVPWQTGGAQGTDDVHNAADGQGTFADNAAWANFNVTSSVQAFAAGTTNYGWRLGWVTGTTGQKPIAAWQHPTQAVRPKLTINYEDGGGCTSSGPYNGTAPEVPGTFEAEHFDCGGEDVGYHDISAGNDGQVFRPNESVEIIAAPGGLAVREFEAGEWLAYTINVPSSGTYDISILASASTSGGGPGAFRVAVDGVEVAGDVTVPLTSGWDDYQWVTKYGVSLSAGTRILRLISVDTYFRIDKVQVSGVVTATCNSGVSRPYSGVPVNGSAISVPGIFEAEHWNCGGEGQGYHEVSAGNGGQAFRPDESVEVIDIAGGIAVRQFDVGEWMAYTIDVPSTGTYDISILASASTSGGPGAFTISIDGNVVPGGAVSVPVNGWDNYSWVKKGGVSLTAGQRELRVISSANYFRSDKIEVKPTGTPPTGGSDACDDGVDFCANFEAAPDTQFSGFHVTSQNVPGGYPIVWSVLNKSGSSTDESRVVLVDGGREGAGSKAIRLTTQLLDNNVQGSGSDRERSMIVLDDAQATNGHEGVEQWWAHSVFFPLDFTMPSGTWSDSLFFQFNHTSSIRLPDGSGAIPPISLNLVNQGGSDPHTVMRVMGHGADGLYKCGESTTDGRQYVYYPPGTDLTCPPGQNGVSGVGGQVIDNNWIRGIWYDFVHHIRWSSTNKTGFHKLWMRRGDGSVIQVLNKPNINTLYRTDDIAFLSIGAYHVNIPDATTSVIHDRIRRGPSFEAVALPDFHCPQGVGQCN